MLISASAIRGDPAVLGPPRGTYVLLELHGEKFYKTVSNTSAATSINLWVNTHLRKLCDTPVAFVQLLQMYYYLKPGIGQRPPWVLTG